MINRKYYRFLLTPVILSTMVFFLWSVSNILYANDTSPMAEIQVIRLSPDVRAMAPAQKTDTYSEAVDVIPSGNVTFIGNDSTGVGDGNNGEMTRTGNQQDGYMIPGTDVVIPHNRAYHPDARMYRIRTGDSLRISIPFEPDTAMSVPVRPDGRINYIYDIEVMAAGLTYQELNKVLRSRLSIYYKTPHVTVIGQSFSGNSVYVLGAVKTPGRHTIQNDTRLLDILSVTGVMSQVPRMNLEGNYAEDLLDLENAYVSRNGRFLGVDFKELLLHNNIAPENNPLLEPGDFIYLPSSLLTNKRIMVVGQVDSPGVYRFGRQPTFLEAVTEAGGPAESGAWVRRCFIIRGGVKSPKETINVNYPAILARDAADVPLENGDVVFVPKTPLTKTTEIIESVLEPLSAILSIDSMAKNSFHEGDRQWKHILTKSRTLGTK